jgi:hypothetical protein
MRIGQSKALPGKLPRRVAIRILGETWTRVLVRIFVADGLTLFQTKSQPI